MVRGCQKRIYYVKDPHSPLFAEAYFVLKESGKSPVYHGGVSASRLAAEADRIVSEFSAAGTVSHPPVPFRERHSNAGQKFGAFMIGAASSSAIIGGIALLLALA